MKEAGDMMDVFGYHISNNIDVNGIESKENEIENKILLDNPGQLIIDRYKVDPCEINGSQVHGCNGSNGYRDKKCSNGITSANTDPKIENMGNNCKKNSTVNEKKIPIDEFDSKISSSGDNDGDRSDLTQNDTTEKSLNNPQKRQVDLIYNLEISKLTNHSRQEWSDIFKNKIKFFNSFKEKIPLNDVGMHCNSNKIEIDHNNKIEGDLPNVNPHRTPLAASHPSASNPPPFPSLDPHDETSILGLDIQESLESSIMINELFSIREHNDLFGRRMTELRCSYTDDDKKPFETCN